jgi:pentatricopeptide repeat-containing protein PET309
LGFPRSYVSISSLPQTTSKPSPSHNNASKGQGPRSSESPDKAGKASASLRAFLEKDGTEFDKAWVLYVAAGFPSNLRPVLCAYLSKSVQPKQRERAWKLFNEISPEDRTKSDFENIISSQLLSPEKPFHLDLICQQAISTPFAQDIISRCLLHMAKHRQWSKITSLWGSLLETPENERLPLDSLLDRFDRIHLPEYSFSRHIFALLAYLQKDTGKLSAAKEDFSRRLIKRFVASRDMIKITPIPTLLSLLRRSRPLGLFTNRHYFDLMEVFLNSKHRSEFVKCILVYRQMRLESPDATPFLYTIRAILDRLLEFNMTESMIYFLDEEAHFDEYNRPSLRSYHGVMDAFSKIGDVRTVQDLFDRLLADHGIPKSQRSVAPLLAVHARLGDVAETRRQFERIPTEFGLPLSPVCWNILLLAYTTAKDLSGAVSTFSEMRENYVPPNSYTFGTLMGIFAERGDVDAIRQLLKEAQKSRVQISRPMLDTAVTVYCKNGQLGHAEALVASSWNLAVGGSPLRMWNFLLMRYAFRVSKFSFRRVLDRMGRLGLKPDQMTYAAIMAAYVYAKQVDRAQDTLRKMHEAGLQATEHHYSILLLGYVKQRNRDMVHVLSREIQARFGRVGMEASLLNLRMQTARDIENAKDLQTPVEDIVLENAEKTLSESIAQFNANPAPVDGRRSEGSAIESFTETHYQRLVDAYGTQGGAEKALQIFTHYMQLRRAAGSSDGDALGSLPIDFIRAVMNAYSETKNYEKVEECWNSIMGRASEEARTYDLDKTLFARSSTLPQPAPTESPLPSILSMSTTEAEKPKIIPAQRFILDNPLSIYLESLARRGMSERIHQVVAEVQAAGFALTGFNWSTYVRVLATSDIYSDNVEAFRLFEEKFIAHFPGWSWFLKGYGVRPINAPVTILHLEGRAGITKPRRMMGRMARRHWRKIEPDYMHPHYPTMVHLASTLQRLRQTSIAQGKENLANIYKIAPKTVDVLAAMPYSRDKHQGVILRGKAPRNHPLPRPAHLFSSRSGALGPSSDMRERSFDNAIKEPLKLNKDEYSEPSVSEWNTSGLLPSGQQKVLGPLASILPREDRIDLETTVLEHFEETISWEERSERYNRIIAMAYKTKDIALADVYKRRLAKMQRANTRRLTRERQLFDKHNRKWKLDASNHLLFKTDTGLHVRPGRKPSQRDAVRNRHKGPWTPSDESGDDR